MSDRPGSDRPQRPVPLNATARAAYQVPGNPVTSRPEDAVANCYPGLELDVRNFDRRFFPGLVFDFIARDDAAASYDEALRYGARLAYVDTQQDPDLDDEAALAQQLDGADGTALAAGDWYIEWIAQAGRRLSTRERRGGVEQPMDGLSVWRLLRGLEHQSVTITLRRRDQGRADVILTGTRRRFTDALSGVISLAYQPGEMLQSLCSPWQHDFRDCYCHYWASNHPDLVFGEVLPGAAVLPDGRPLDPARGNLRLDWLRADRAPERAAAALNTYAANRPSQYDHYEINEAWRELNMVLNDTEIGNVYVPRGAEQATPFASPEELATALRGRLAPLEMALAIEYLYARASLLSAAEAGDRSGNLHDAVVAARHVLLLTAASEMQHLRWVNELLWTLHAHGIIAGSYQPVLMPAERIPCGTAPVPGGTASGLRERALRRLEPLTLQQFINVEHPSGLIDGAYARVIATLRDTATYPPELQQVALRIAADGVQHESNFLDLRAVLAAYPEPYGYLRPLAVGRPEQPEVAPARQAFARITEGLGEAYLAAARGDLPRMGVLVATSRQHMDTLLAESESLAARGIGVPYWPAG